jgi:hypothetical protein
LNKLKRLLVQYKFSFGPAAIQTHFRLLTPVSALSMHLIAEQADYVTVMYDKESPVKSVKRFLSVDCPLCRVFTYPVMSYNFKLAFREFTEDDCKRVDCKI